MILEFEKKRRKGNFGIKIEQWGKREEAGKKYSYVLQYTEELCGLLLNYCMDGRDLSFRVLMWNQRSMCITVTIFTRIVVSLTYLSVSYT